MYTTLITTHDLTLVRLDGCHCKTGKEGLGVEVEIVLARALGDIRIRYVSVGENHKRAYRSNKTDGVWAWKICTSHAQTSLQNADAEFLEINGRLREREESLYTARSDWSRQLVDITELRNFLLVLSWGGRRCSFPLMLLSEKSKLEASGHCNSRWDLGSPLTTETSPAGNQVHTCLFQVLRVFLQVWSLMNRVRHWHLDDERRGRQALWRHRRPDRSHGHRQTGIVFRTCAESRNVLKVLMTDLKYKRRGKQWLRHSCRSAVLDNPRRRWWRRTPTFSWGGCSASWAK